MNEHEIYEAFSHSGVKRRSGRYPWGSGDDPELKSGDFLSRVEKLKKSGASEKEIADHFEISTGMLRTQIGLAGDERRQLSVDRAKALREGGMSLPSIAAEMGFKNDSSVRTLLNSGTEERMKLAKNTANFIKEQVDTKGMIDVGKGVEKDLGITSIKLDQALYMLEMQNYPVYGGGAPQINRPGKQTNMRIVCPPGTEHKDIYQFDKISSIKEYVSHDDGESFTTMQYPASMNSKRLAIRYREKGGLEKDGVIELRRGVADLSLGDAHYAQVRILVDKNLYLKGMAVYGDRMPPGVDVIFNTNKEKGTPINKVLKGIHLEDPMNPFGSAIKKKGQSEYIDENGKKKLSLINKRADEDDWSNWKDKCPSQFLAKQNRVLIKKQLDQAADKRKAEFETINSLTNPTLKKKMLDDFAKSCDKDAERLSGAALPGQKYHVLLPINSLKDTEVYAPNYDNGQQVALIRFPHGGTFEIPILTVNNKNANAIKTIGKTSKDAIGITAKVAERLSGADFDGDAAMVIPLSKKVQISSKPPLEELVDFDPKMQYPPRAGMKKMTNTENEMGRISNLITDMTLKGAQPPELARAVKHSMVVIDAEKHGLDYKQSEKDNQILSLKEKYQKKESASGRVSYGAATLISKAKSPENVIRRQGSPKVDPKTGDLVWKNVDEIYREDYKTGKKVLRQQESTKMMEVKDARTLSTGHPKEELYADYANDMKSLARTARLTKLSTKDIPANHDAKTRYAKEVKELDAALFVAETNSPKERMATIMANAKLQACKQDNPELKSDKEMVRKIGQQEIERARAVLGAKKEKIVVTDKQWEAIQAGAISPTKLRQVLNNADNDVIKQKAMPKGSSVMSATQVSRIKNMASMGYTTAEIAARFGISTSTVRDNI